MSRVSWGKALESRIQDQERQAVWDSISWDLICSTGYQWLQLSTCWPLEHSQKQMGYHSAVVIRCRLHVAVHSMTQTQTLVFQQANKQNEPCTSQIFSIVSSFFARVAKWGWWPQPNETVSWRQSYLMNTPRCLHIVLHSFRPRPRFDDACNKSLGAESRCPRIASRSTVAAIAWKPNDSIRLMNWIRRKLADQHPHRCAVSYVLAQWGDHMLY